MANTEHQQQETAADPDFCGLVESLDYGAAAVELNTELGNVLRNLHEHARKTQAAGAGEVSLKVKVGITAKGQLTFAYDVNAKGPKPARGESVFWMNDRGQLVTSPPKQLKMFGEDETPSSGKRRAAKEV
jgi:hypothetical protein